MIGRVIRGREPLKRSTQTGRRGWPRPAVGESLTELALAYSNGVVTVEISRAALDAYIEATGDVPLPDVVDSQTGDRHLYDPDHDVRVVYDRLERLREVSTRSNDGLFVRMNFIHLADIEADRAAANQPADGASPSRQSML